MPGRSIPAGIGVAASEGNGFFALVGADAHAKAERIIVLRRKHLLLPKIAHLLF